MVWEDSYCKSYNNESGKHTTHTTMNTIRIPVMLRCPRPSIPGCTKAHLWCKSTLSSCFSVCPVLMSMWRSHHTNNFQLHITVDHIFEPRWSCPPTFSCFQACSSESRQQPWGGLPASACIARWTDLGSSFWAVVFKSNTVFGWCLWVPCTPS